MCVCTLLLLPSAACFVGGRAACKLQPDYHADTLAAVGQARAASSSARHPAGPTCRERCCVVQLPKGTCLRQKTGVQQHGTFSSAAVTHRALDTVCAQADLILGAYGLD